MKIIMPSFGFISAIATSIAFLPHTLVLLGIILLNGKEATFLFLSFTILVRLIGDWLFWTSFFPSEMDSEENLTDWRSSVKGILSSQPLAIKSMFDMGVDALVDITLIYAAFQVSAPPLWILFIFSACQVVGTPIQGAILRIVDRQGFRLFSMIIAVLATFLALEINGLISHGYYTRLFELSHYSKDIQMLIILGVKCLFTGTTVIAKETLAEIIKVATIKNPEKYGIQSNGS